MKKIVGMGETVLDILFRGGQPVASVHGGSSFNSIISIGRAGVPCCFVGYTGADIVGRQTVDFMQQNGVGTQFFDVRQGEKSAISLAFLNDQGDANYSFYRQPLHASSDPSLPPMEADDVLLYGSYYAACPGMRPLVTQLLNRAGEAGSIVYYDLNFRRSHQHELDVLTPAILSNLRQSTLVRGSSDDLEVIYGTREARDVYDRHISRYCPLFLCTAGAGRITVCTPQATYEFQAPLIQDVVSTVGAGDNFNAGFSCALVWQGISKQQLYTLDQQGWGRLIDVACQFAGEACRSTQNYISVEFGAKVRAIIQEDLHYVH